MLRRLVVSHVGVDVVVGLVCGSSGWYVLNSSVGIDLFFFFFFQAEDGIRDLVRSRGLGDVYKRQFDHFAPGTA